MTVNFKDMFSTRELLALSSMIQVSDATYHDLMETQRPMFRHPYFSDIRGRIRTKLAQMQCEIESHDPEFPFRFFQRNFDFGHTIPELRNKNVVLHIARSSAPDELPYKSQYKISFSNRNNPLKRQMIIDLNSIPPYKEDLFYALLVFGGRKETFSAIQFPEPGYKGIIEILSLPQLSLINEEKSSEVFERKKAVLKKEFLAHKYEEDIL